MHKRIFLFSLFLMNYCVYSTFLSEENRSVFVCCGEQSILVNYSSNDTFGAFKDRVRNRMPNKLPNDFYFHFDKDSKKIVTSKEFDESKISGFIHLYLLFQR